MDKTEISPDTNALLERFARGPSVAERARVITDLLARKTLARVLKMDAFRTGLAGFQASLGMENKPEIRLAALAQMVRIAQSAKPAAKEIMAMIMPALALELPPASLLNEADDRSYVAKACGWSREGWVTDYAFRAIAEEETGEKARREFV